MGISAYAMSILYTLLRYGIAFYTNENNFVIVRFEGDLLCFCSFIKHMYSYY